MLKTDFIPPIVFEILKLKNRAIRLAGRIFTFISRIIMEHDFNPKNLHINGLIFLLNPKKNYFESIFGIPPK